MANRTSLTLFALTWLVSIVPALTALGQTNLETATSTSGPLPVPDLILKVERSVVKILLYGTRWVTNDQGIDEEQFALFSGTGFAIDAEGHIVTNAHVLHPPEIRWVKKPTLSIELPELYRALTPEQALMRSTLLGNPKEQGAFHPEDAVDFRSGKGIVNCTVVGFDHLADLAVLKTVSGLIPPLRFADPASIRVGEEVIAMGYGMGVFLKGGASVTHGIVGAVRRSLVFPGQNEISASFGGLLQTDAAINPGNSGGPLLNMQGEVIGVNTITLAAMDSVQGFYFARSCETAQPFVQTLIEKGQIVRGSLGIQYSSVEPSNSAFEELADGAIVLEVQSGSPGATGGLKPNDMIVQLGRFPIRCGGDLDDALAFYKSGEEVRVQLRSYAKHLEPETYRGTSSFSKELYRLSHPELYENREVMLRLQ